MTVALLQRAAAESRTKNNMPASFYLFFRYSALHTTKQTNKNTSLCKGIIHAFLGINNIGKTIPEANTPPPPSQEKKLPIVKHA